METRLIIAYSLIAIMVGAAIFLSVVVKRNRDKARLRSMGNGYNKTGSGN